MFDVSQATQLIPFIALFFAFVFGYQAGRMP